MSRPFRRPEAVLSLSILMGEMNVVADYDQFFCPIGSEIHIGSIFQKTHSDTNLAFLRHRAQEKINLVGDFFLSHFQTRWKDGSRGDPAH